MSLGTEIRNGMMVRLADPDIEPVVDWCQANAERNGFDRDTLTYPSTKVLCAHRDGVVDAYMPIQGTAMLESIGPNPEATPMQIANAVKEMVSGAELLAYNAGYRELYFLASDETTALGAEKIGFERLPYMVYRKRL